MAVERVNPPAHIVKISNDFARSKIDVKGKTAQDLLACLISCIKDSDTQFKAVYSIDVKKYLGNEGAIFKYARQACKELVKATVEDEFTIENEENPEDNRVFIAMPIFLSVKYSKGIVSAVFNPNLSTCLLEQKAHFTQLTLGQFLDLPTQYSKNMYRQLKSWASLPDVYVKISELHKFLGTPPSFRADFKAFRVRVLEKVQQEIHKHTGLRYEWEPVKVGKSVEMVRFIFARGGKRAIDSAAKQAAEDAKRRRLKGARMSKAFDCARKKQGECRTMDKSRLVCQVCQEFDYCGDILRNRPKRDTPPRA